MTQALWLDGNALAGTLAEMFGAEMTAALRDCPSCGTRSAVGEHRLYRAAGAVLRCPHCGDVAMRVSEHHVVTVTGAWTMQVSS